MQTIGPQHLPTGHPSNPHRAVRIPVDTHILAAILADRDAVIELVETDEHCGEFGGEAQNTGTVVRVQRVRA